MTWKSWLELILALLALIFGAYLFYNWHKSNYIPIETITTTVDTIYVTVDKVIPQINTVKIPITQTVTDTVYQTFPVIVNDSLSYEVANIDTTFIFQDVGWHRLQISYDEYYNYFSLASAYAFKQTNIMTTNPEKEKLRKQLILYSAYGINSDELELGTGFGLEYKRLGLGLQVTTEKKLGLFLQIGF